ncbi:hypothetical protein [Clostridium magnum]|uniref:Uncharacterized protein n=1 Tax=Clostridium magnum DSM 2767 TaxID=1121326 RepID=A0A162TKL4_9CLOT|nr:hypothetical protein [Clostridium magnum]KZL92765.1 hypothetical protein CLMAG_25790 [Clostridium magnum DSM 2767]SHJ53175.1 hypothetical protein SAMN02745944_06114 [Clostridium magnum DSM 2767]
MLKRSVKLIASLAIVVSSLGAIGVQPRYAVRPDRAHILAGGTPVKVRFTKSPCIESWRCCGNVTF